MNKHLVPALLLMFSLTAAAAPKTTKKIVPTPVSEESSVRETALKENQSIDKKAYKKTIQATESQQANVASFLKLQDPTPELRDRPWLYTFALKLQSLQPLGTGKVGDMIFDLNRYGTGLMPSLEFGFLIDVADKKKFSWASGLSAHAGYMNQKTNLVTPIGYQYKDTRLTTSLISAIWNNRFRLGFAPEVSLLLNPEVGFVNYTQTNTESSIANFNQQNNYWGLSLGAEHSFTRKWAVLAQYSYREASAKNIKTSNLQKNNIEIGTQVTW
jgi:opacity protein-like surface antigen